MQRSLIIAILLLSSSGCVPIKTTYYESIDRPRVAAATQGNLLPCPAIDGYGVGFRNTTTRLHVSADPVGARARIDIFVPVMPLHQITFQTLNIQLTSLSDPAAASSAPLTFYIYCNYGEHERNCPRIPSEVHTLEAPATASSFPAKYVGIVDVPPELASGFIVILPDIYDGSSKLEAVPLRFLRRNGVVLRGEGGCQ
jgi:hypothetical protein